MRKEIKKKNENLAKIIFEEVLSNGCENAIEQLALVYGCLFATILEVYKMQPKERQLSFKIRTKGSLDSLKENLEKEIGNLEQNVLLINNLNKKN